MQKKILKVVAKSHEMDKIIYALKKLKNVSDATFNTEKNCIEIFISSEVSDKKIIDAVNSAGDFKIFDIE